MWAPMMQEPMEPRLQALAWHRRRQALANLSRVELPRVELPPVNQALANQAPASSLPVNQAMVKWKVWDPAPPQEKPKLEPGKTKTKVVEEFA